MLEVQQLQVSYGAHEALSGVSLGVDTGEIVVILGANGAGKSSLLQAIAGVSEGRVSGGVRLDGNAIEMLPANRIVEAGIAFVPEGRGIFADLSVEENLLLGAYSERARPAQHANLQRVYDLFPKLLDRSRQVSRTMSGGEQQMVAIGRALMSNPALLLLDEPSLGLSPLLCKELFQTLRLVRDAGIGVLMVEQNARQSLAIADRCYLIENGAVTGGGDARAMLDDPAVQAAYLGGAAAATAVSTGVGVAAVPAAASDKTYITPGRGTAAAVAVPVDDFVARAARLQSPAARPRPVQPRSEPADRPHSANPPRPAPASTASSGSHQQQVDALLASFESAATLARLGTTAETTARSPTVRPPAKTHRPAPAIVPKPPSRPAPAKAPAGGLEIFERGADGQLHPRQPDVQGSSGHSPRNGERGSSLQIFRRGADGKMIPVRR